MRFTAAVWFFILLVRARIFMPTHLYVIMCAVMCHVVTTMYLCTIMHICLCACVCVWCNRQRKIIPSEIREGESPYWLINNVENGEWWLHIKHLVYTHTQAHCTYIPQHMYTQHIKHLVSTGRFTITGSMLLHLATKLICSHENICADGKQDGANLMDSFIGHIVGIKIWSQFHHDANVCQKVS